MAMPRIALRIAYDGSRFHGFQRQPDERTVEGELLLALEKIGAIKNPKSANYRLSSRTDRGVSALGNVVSIDTKFNIHQLPRAINSNVNDAWCTGVAMLPDDFDVRRAVSRTYACYLLDNGENLDKMRKAAKRFRGTHDFSRYAKADGRNPERTVGRIGIKRKGPMIEFVVEGESFLWNQVRRMVWALMEVGSGRAKADDLSPERFRMRRSGLVPAESLILLEVDIGTDFELPNSLGRTCVDVKSRFLASNVKSSLLSGMLDQLGCKL
jgi:tRNA pseudouridine38-40 synthase